MLRAATTPLRLSRRGAALAVGTSATAVVGVGASGYYAATNENHTFVGFQRQSQFWRRVFPVVLDYYWNFGRHSPLVRYQKWSQGPAPPTEEELPNAAADRQQLLQELHEKHAQAILQVILDLKGLYVKLGQVLSVTALPIPEAYRVRFRTLQSDVPGWEEFETAVQPVLEQELGVASLDELFSYIDPIPCGAASIGQAHLATLRDGNDQVIVKVQYPNAAWQVPADIQCVGDFLKLCVMAGVVDETASRLSFEEFSRQFLAELDYDLERQNLQQVYESSLEADAPYVKRGVVVPAVYPDLCTGKVITMTYLPGPKLEEEARRQLEMIGIDTNKGIGSIVRNAAEDSMQSTQDEPGTSTQSSYSTEIEPTNSVAAVPQDGSDVSVVPPAGTAPNSWKIQASRLLGQWIGFDTILWTVRFGRRVMLWSTAAAVVTIQTTAAVLPQSLSEWAESHQFAAQQAGRLALTESWIDALFDVHGHQIFVLGTFNADCHPGNILVLEEEGREKAPRLGLIDFGQCKRLKPEEQVRVAKLILTVANNESDDNVATAFRELGVQTKNDSTEFLAHFARLMFGPLQSQHLSHSWHKNLHAMDRVDYFPNELSMVYRTSLLLRGLAFSLQINASIGEQWRNHAQATMDRHDNLERAVTKGQQEQGIILGNQLVASTTGS